MHINRKIAAVTLSVAALMGTGGVAYASVTPTTPNPTYTPPTIQPTPTITPTIAPRPVRRCTVQFDRLAITPVFNPFTGRFIRAGQWDRVCLSRFGVTITPLSLPIQF
jgi:hypothetical protein